MSAKDLAGLAGVIFVLTSAVAIFAELTDSAGGTLQALRLAAYGVAAVMLGIAYALHRRQLRADAEAQALGRTPAHGLPAQREPRKAARSR